MCRQVSLQEAQSRRTGFPEGRHPHHRGIELGEVTFRLRAAHSQFSAAHSVSRLLFSSAEEGPLPRQAQRHGGGGAGERRRRAREAGSAWGPQSEPHAVCVPPPHTHTHRSVSFHTVGKQCDRHMEELEHLYLAGMMGMTKIKKNIL